MRGSSQKVTMSYLKAPPFHHLLQKGMANHTVTDDDETWGGFVAHNRYLFQIRNGEKGRMVFRVFKYSIKWKPAILDFVAHHHWNGDGGIQGILDGGIFAVVDAFTQVGIDYRHFFSPGTAGQTITGGQLLVAACSQELRCITVP